MKKFAVLLSFALLFSTGIVFAQEEAIETSAATLIVAESAVCTGISDRQPDGTASEFSQDVPKIYYWTRINGAQDEETVKHIWYHGDTVIGEISLNIKTPSFRTWSSKTVYPGLVGEMSVAVVDLSGNVLKRDEFTIK